MEIQSQLRRLLRELRKAESEGLPSRKSGARRPIMTFVMALGGVLLVALVLVMCWSTGGAAVALLLLLALLGLLALVLVCY